jgi:hypothetical protein
MALLVAAPEVMKVFNPTLPFRFGRRWSQFASLTAVAALSLSMPAYGGEPAPADTLGQAPADSVREMPMEHAAKHQAATYSCPMHSQIVRDAPGKCPMCGMFLEKKTASESR